MLKAMRLKQSPALWLSLRQSGAWRALLAPISLGTGAAAQALLGADHLLWAAVLYLAAVLGLALAVAGQPLASFACSADVATARQSGPSGPPSGTGAPAAAWPQLQEATRTVGAVAFAASAGMLAASLALFADGPDALAWWLYGGSMLALLLSLPSLDGRWADLARRLGEKRSLASVGLADALHWALLAAVLALALLVRLYHLDTLPAGLWYDEADNLYQANRIQKDPGATPVFVPSTNLPSFYLLPIAGVVDLAGVSITAGRLVSVMFGLAGVAVAFLLGRLAFGPWLGLVAALLTAVMRWHLNWSRIGMHGITTPLFAALAAYLTLRALRSGRASDYGYAGAALGLGLWSYAPFRLFPLVVGFMLLHYLVFQRPNLRRFAGKVLLMGVVAAMVAAPVLESAVLEADRFFGRTATTSVFSLVSPGEALGEIRTSLWKHALMFNYHGDLNARHNLPGAPMLDFGMGVLFVLGLGLALGRWRRVELAALPAWVLVMVAPGVITLPWEAPQSLRAIGVVPAVALCATLALGALWRAGRSAPWPWVRRALPALLLGALGAIAFANINTYFGAQARHPAVYSAFSTDETLRTRDMLTQQGRGYTLLTSRQFLYGLTTAVLAPEVRYDVLRPPDRIPIDVSQVWKGAAVYIEPRESSFYRLLRAYYPEAESREVRPPGGGDVLYYSALISREQMESSLGLEARYTFADGTAREAIVHGTEAAWLLEDLGAGPPFDVTWKGTLHIVKPGEYLLRLEGPPSAEVWLDGARLLWQGRRSVRVLPAVGLHWLEVRAHVTDPASALRLLWQPPEGELGPVPPQYLYHGPVRPVGLVGRFYRSGREQGEPDAMHVTPALDVFYYDPVVPEPYLAVWEGTLEAPVGGDYRFRVLGAGKLRLYLDGNLLAQDPESPWLHSQAGIALGAGKHRVRLEYTPLAPPSQFEVQWAMPGKELGPVPIEALSPAPEHMFRVLP